MAASSVSSIIFFLLFIILSLFVDGNVFAAQMEHRKLGVAKETKAMRRNLEENGCQGFKMVTPGSTSPQSGQRNTKNEPSQTYPNQATAQGKKPYLSYVGILHKPASDTMAMRRNLKGNGEGPSKIGVRGSTSPTAGGKTANVPMKNQPNQVTAQKHKYISYGTIPRAKVPFEGRKCRMYERCKREIGN